MIIVNFRMGIFHTMRENEVIFICWSIESVVQSIGEGIMRQSSVVIKHRSIGNVELKSLLLCYITTLYQLFFTIYLFLCIHSEDHEHFLVSDIEYSNVFLFSICLEIFSIPLFKLLDQTTIILVRDKKIIGFIKLIEALFFGLDSRI